MPKKPLFGSKRPKTKLANGKMTRRVHHGALGVRRSQTPRAQHLSRTRTSGDVPPEVAPLLHIRCTETV